MSGHTDLLMSSPDGPAHWSSAQVTLHLANLLPVPGAPEEQPGGAGEEDQEDQEAEGDVEVGGEPRAWFGQQSTVSQNKGTE